MGLIYLAVNTVNNKVYIGKTVKTLQTRKTNHLAKSKTNSNTAFMQAIRKYGFNTFKWYVLQDTLPESELYAAEIYWINFYKSNGFILYNETTGGDGTHGYKHSTETLAKIAASNTGKTYRAETYQLLSPNGEVVTITNMKEFCRINGFDNSFMCKVATGKRRSAYGYSTLKQL